jgi:hypothetical protein
MAGRPDCYPASCPCPGPRSRPGRQMWTSRFRFCSHPFQKCQSGSFVNWQLDLPWLILHQRHYLVHMPMFRRARTLKPRDRVSFHRPIPLVGHDNPQTDARFRLILSSWDAVRTPFARAYCSLNYRPRACRVVRRGRSEVAGLRSERCD